MIRPGAGVGEAREAMIESDQFLEPFSGEVRRLPECDLVDNAMPKISPCECSGIRGEQEEAGGNEGKRICPLLRFRELQLGRSQATSAILVGAVGTPQSAALSR